MFKKLFQAKTSPDSKVAVLDKPKYSKEIEQVHHEFEIAAELLYEEAVAILTNNKINNPDKINRLKNLGFCAVKEVVEVKEKEEKTKMSKETIELIQSYRVKYPMNKFITQQQVDTICQKYGLVWGPISKFTGFVPEANLNAIERFASKYQFKTAMISRNSSMRDGMIIEMKNVEIIKPGEKDKRGIASVGYGYIVLTFADGSTLELQQDRRNWDGINFYGTPTNNVRITSKFDFVYLCLTSLQIAGPQKDFDMNGMTVKNFQVVKQVPDPVVLQPVQGGFLIVTAWGDEASDPIVMHELNN